MTYVDDRKPARSRLRVGLATVLFVIYLAFVMWVTMSPSLDGIGVDSVADRVLGVLHRIGIPDAFGYMQLEVTANIGMFIPLGFLLGLALPGWGWWLALILLPAYSYGIEWFQGEFLGDRVSDVRDIISNSIGAWIGTLAAAFLRALVHSRDDKVIARAIWEEQRESRVARPAQASSAPVPSQYIRPAARPAPAAAAPAAYPVDPPTTVQPTRPYGSAQRPHDPNATEVLDGLGWGGNGTPTAPTQIIPR
jgi:glycopeptide antibiotics resistance protein